MSDFRRELEQVINRHSKENAGGDTPDFILAEMLAIVLTTVGTAIHKRDQWYGHPSASVLKRFPIAPTPQGEGRRVHLDHCPANPLIAMCICDLCPACMAEPGEPHDKTCTTQPHGA